MKQSVGEMIEELRKDTVSFDLHISETIIIKILRKYTDKEGFGYASISNNLENALAEALIELNKNNGKK